MLASPRRLLLTLALAAMATAQYIEVGCYTSVPSSYQNKGYATYQSYGNCEKICTGLQAPVMALTNGSTCYCGDALPPASAKTSSSTCSLSCQGYPANNCGGPAAYNVLKTGVESDGPTSGQAGNGGSSSSSSTSISTTSSLSTPTSPTRTRHGGGQTVVTSIGQATTVIVTQAPSSSTPSSGKKSGGGTNVGAVAAGVVVGVLAIVSIVAGVFFYLRHKRRAAAEEEYKRTQVSDFMRGGERKPPGTGYSQMSDSRLDPEAGARRNSHGSIADNQDYSRRVLRVANPDWS